MTDTINKKQAGILLSFALLSDKFILLPSLVFTYAKWNSFFIIMLMLLIEVLMIYLLIKLKEANQNKTIFEILNQKLGKFFTKTIYVLLFLYFLMRILVILNENYAFLKELVYEDATFFNYIVCILPVVNALVFYGLRTLGRTAQFFFWFIVFGLLSIFMIGIFSTTFSFPILHFELSSLVHIPKLMFWFGDFLFLLLFIDKVKLEDNFGKTIMRYVFLTVGLLAVLYFIFYGLYEYATFMYNGALADIVQFSLINDNIGKADIISVLTKMFAIFFQVSVMFYALKECLGKIFKVSLKQSIVILDFIIVSLQYFLLLTMSKMVDLSISYFSYFSWIVIFALPVVFFFVFLKTRRKRGKYERIY